MYLSFYNSLFGTNIIIIVISGGQVVWTLAHERCRRLSCTM